MLHNILTHETCAKCRICCSFVKEDAWESPLFSKEDMERIKKAGILEDCFDKVCKDGREVYMAHYEFHDEKEILLCPCLDEKKGCILGSEKPFECSIWPIRIFCREDDEGYYLGLAGICPAFEGKNYRKLLQELQENGLGEKILALKGRQEILKEIQEGYKPIYPEEKSV